MRLIIRLVNRFPYGRGSVTALQSRERKRDGVGG